jgi:cell division septum initiation protein DivIVA
MDPDRLGERDFARIRKGWDPEEVRPQLRAAADEIRRLQLTVAELQTSLNERDEARATPTEIDPDQLDRLVGEETARVLEAARTAAKDIRGKATIDAETLVNDATETATRLRTAAEEAKAEADRTVADLRASSRAEADRLVAEASSRSVELREEAERDAAATRAVANDVLAERSAEAEAAAAEIRSAAEAFRSGVEAQCEELRQAADAYAQETRDAADAGAELVRSEAAADAAARLAEATEQGREVVREAREARERMLTDLADRRQESKRQLEALRAAHEHMLGAFRSAQTDLSSAMDRLADAVPGAQDAAADAAVAIDHAPESAADLLTVLDLAEPTFEAKFATETPESLETLVVTEISVEEFVVIEDLEPDTADVEAPDDAPDAAHLRLVASQTASQRLADELREDLAEMDLDSLGHVDGILGVNGHDSDDESGRDPDGLDHVDRIAVDPETGAADAIFARLRAERGGTDPEPESPGAVVITLPHPDDAAESAAAEVGADEPDAAELEAGDEVADAETAVTVSSSELLDRRDRELEPIELRLVRSAKRAVSAHENVVLDRVRRDRRQLGTADELLAIGDLRTAVQAACSADLTQLVEAGATFHDDGAHQRMVHSEEWVPELVSLVDLRLLDELELRLLTVFEDRAGVSDPDAVVSAMRSVFRTAKNDLIPEVMSDVATAGFNQGILSAADDDAQHCWIVDGGGSPCPDAEDNHLAGAVTCGEAFPTGDLRPPAHPGCRCLLDSAPK